MDKEKFSEEELHKLYMNWIQNRSPEEFKLHLTILDYQYTLFEDMTFQEKSLCWEIAAFIHEEIEPLFLELDPALYRFYIVDDNKKYAGQCNGIEHTICITRSYIDDKKVILHEMIHAYEFILKQRRPMLEEYLLLALYRKLSPLVPDLDNRLAQHGELYGQDCVSASGGYHGLLFYLKSLDLDIRCNYEPGTVCGYGRDTGDMWY